MLTSLLPGIRQLRAPLAAGFIWIAALWLLIEPSWPDSANQVLLGSLNRLLGIVSLIGLGVVVSFAAYVIGSISVFLCSALLARVFRQPRQGILSVVSSLSKDAVRSLDQVVRDGRERIEDELALTGVDIDEVLSAAGERADARGRIEALLPGEAIAPGTREPRQVAQADGPLGSLEAVERERRQQQGELAARVLRDLPVIAEAQLLGKDPEAFSAVDRSEAEVEFRLALIPALLGFAVSVAAVLERPTLSIVAIAIGVLVVVALLLDASRRRRDANALILTLLEHDRAISPSIGRAASRAAQFADQRPDRVVRRGGDETSRLLRQLLVEVNAFAIAIEEYLRNVDWLIDSGFLAGTSEALGTSEAARTAGERLAKLLARLVPDDVVLHRSVGDVIAPLDRVLGASRAFFDSHAGQDVGSALKELHQLVERNNSMIHQARITRDEWVTEMRDLVRDLAVEAGQPARPPGWGQGRAPGKEVADADPVRPQRSRMDNRAGRQEG